MGLVREMMNDCNGKREIHCVVPHRQPETIGRENLEPEIPGLAERDQILAAVRSDDQNVLVHSQIFAVAASFFG